MANEPDIHEIARAVAYELTAQSRSFRVTWTAHDDRGTDRGYPWPELRPTFEHDPCEYAGPTLIMQGPSWSGAGRIRVALMIRGLVAPGDDLRRYPDAPSIGLSATKAPDRIAADILRRLWGDACTVAEQIREKVGIRSAEDNERDRVAALLAESIGSSVRWDNMHHEDAPKPGADVTVYMPTSSDSAARFTVSSGGGIRVECIGCLTLDQSLRIAATLGA